MKKEKTFYIIISIISVIVVAGLGALFVNLGMNWFDKLDKPSQWVPNILIPIVWTIIYCAFAVYLIFAILKNKINKNNIIYLIINGFLNIIWCLIFFTLNSMFLGLIAIILNLIFAILLIISINRQYKLFSYILLIYPLWLMIATCLNLAVWILN